MELLTPWSWSLLERTSVVQLLKNFQAFYGNMKFITVFRVLNLVLSWARSIQSIPPHPIQDPSTYVLEFLVVSSLTVFPPITYTHSSSHPLVLYSMPISFSLTRSSLLYSAKSTSFEAHQYSVFSSHLSLCLFFIQTFSLATCNQTSSVYVYGPPLMSETKFHTHNSIILVYSNVYSFRFKKTKDSGLNGGKHYQKSISL
jgi:hypothetical protein